MPHLGDSLGFERSRSEPPPIQARLYRIGIAAFTVLALLSQPGTAGPYDEGGYAPALMAAWASEVYEFQRGFRDIADPSLGQVTFGVPENALGAATGNNMHVFSLGDSGHITLYFVSGIGNGAGDDFAVFENGFFTSGGLFAEFAFVEVSSNAVDFAEFSSHTVNTEPVPTAGTIDPSEYRNLAGDQPLELGTGFDLEELASDPLVQAALLDLDDVRYVRLTDVIGDGSTTDSFGNPVYDPYPTPFDTGGFDIEAVGVLHVAPEAGAIQMLLSGAACLCALRRRRFRQRCYGLS